MTLNKKQRMLWGRAATILLASYVWSAGCRENSDNSQDGVINDTHKDDMAGDNTCEIVATIEVDWNEATDLGTPKDAFATMPGNCKTSFTWDGTGWNDGSLTVSPTTGQGEVSVTVEFDQASAKIVEQVPAENAFGDVECENYLSADALVAIDILGSEVVNQKRVELLAYKNTSDNDTNIRVDIKEDELLKWLTGTQDISIFIADDVTAGMNIEIMPLQTACVGEITLHSQMSLDDNTGVASVGPFGSWSDTGCGINEEPVDLSAPNEEFGSVLEQIETLWEEISYPGTWDDGNKTTLEMDLMVSITDACMSRGQVFVPAEVSYGTTDNRLGDSTVPANLNVSIEASGQLRTSSIYISEDRVCESTSDSLSYTLGTCEDLKSITIQLGIDRSENGDIGVSDEGLMIYEYDRASSADPGAADRVRILALNP